LPPLCVSLCLRRSAVPCSIFCGSRLLRSHLFPGYDAEQHADAPDDAAEDAHEMRFKVARKILLVGDGNDEGIP